MSASSTKRSPLGLIVLWLLYQQPLHVYGMQKMLEAQLGWVRGVIADLREGRLDWSEEWLRQIAAAFIGADDQHSQDDHKDG